MLLNRFTIWCQLAQMILRVDKCSTFGIRKQLTKSIQYLPKLFINNCLVSRVELGKSFRYLGRYFDFNTLSSTEPYEFLVKLRNITWEINYAIVSQNALGMMGRRKLRKALPYKVSKMASNLYRH